MNIETFAFHLLSPLADQQAGLLSYLDDLLATRLSLSEVLDE